MNRPLIEYLPSFIQKSNIYQAIFGSSEPELEDLEAAVDDLEKQLNIDTATWALDIYEKDLGIVTDHNKSLSDRRSVIKSLERGTGKVDADLIKSVADAYANGDATVAFNGNILITFTSVLGRPPNIADLFKAVEDIKPAHLQALYFYKYLFISEIHNVMTLTEMESRELTDFAPFEPVV